jgi:hypothetical protein
MTDGAAAQDGKLSQSIIDTAVAGMIQDQT